MTACEECGWDEYEEMQIYHTGDYRTEEEKKAKEEIEYARKKLFDGHYYCDECWYYFGIEKMRNYYLLKKYNEFFEFLETFEKLYPDRWASFSHEELIEDKLKYYQLIIEAYINSIINENTRLDEATVFFNKNRETFLNLFRINHKNDMESRLLQSFFESFIVFIETLTKYRRDYFENVYPISRSDRYSYLLRIESFENGMRQFIKNHLEHNYQDDWKEHIPTAVKDKIAKGKINCTKKRFYAIEQEDLNYCDIGDYESIITYNQNWSMFEKIFHDKEFLIRNFDDLRTFRNNVIAHPKEYDESYIKRGEAALYYFESLWNTR